MTFIAWAATMIVAFAALVWIGQRSRPISVAAESAAEEALPVIGQIAEAQHRRKFGRAPSNAAAPRQKSVSWYPPVKKKTADRA
jgi:hypothetical protein